MTETPLSRTTLYRLNRFVVPLDARDEFLATAKEIHRLLREQAGFVREAHLEQPGPEGAFVLVTLTQWRDETSVLNAQAAMAAMQRQTGLDAQALMARLGVRAEFGHYRSVEL